MGNSYENEKLRQYVKYINIISSMLLVVSLICIADMCLCAYGFDNMSSNDDGNTNPKQKDNGLKDILLALIITLGLSTAFVIISSILLFLFAMKIIHVSKVGSILNGMISTSNPNTQRPLLQDYEVPITCNNTQNRPRTTNLYTDRNTKSMSKKAEMLPVYDEVQEEPTFFSTRPSMSPQRSSSRKIKKNIEELPDYDEVKEFNVASNSRKMVAATNEELPEYHEPIYPNAPNIPQSRFYEKLRQETEELVDYDEVKTVDVETNTGSKIMKTLKIRQEFPVSVYDKLSENEEELVDYDEIRDAPEEIITGSSNMKILNNQQFPISVYNKFSENEEELVDYDEVRDAREEIITGSPNMKILNNQQFPVSVYNKLSENKEELVDYDEVKEANKEMKAGSSNMEMKKITREYLNKIKQNQSEENTTESISLGDKATYSKSLENLLESFNMPANEKLKNQSKNSSNEIRMENTNEQLHNKKMTPQSTRKISYGMVSNTKNVFASTSKNIDLNMTLQETSTTKTSRSIQKFSYNRTADTETNNSDEYSDYDFIKN